jgi:Sec-independent protein secretion pathway component TatC
MTPGAAYLVGVAKLFGQGWARDSWKRMTGRSTYKPSAVIYVGAVGILLAALLGRFWVGLAVLIPVILYGWWRFWAASRSDGGGHN